jgi:hypothetical protein
VMDCVTSDEETPVKAVGMSVPGTTMRM